MWILFRLKQLLILLVIGLAAFLLLALKSCSDESGLISKPILQDTGVIALAEPVAEIHPAGQVRLDINSTQALPEEITVQSVKFVAIPFDLGHGKSYVPKLEVPEAGLVPLDPFDAVALPGVTQASIQPVIADESESIQPVIADESESIQPVIADESGSETILIYQGNPNDVDFEDYALIYATGQLPTNLRTAENIAITANDVYPQGNFDPNLIDPVPNEENTDFVRGGSSPPPDLIDVGVVYGAFLLPPNLRTSENIALMVNTVVPGASLVADDIVAIPGVSLPGENTAVPAR